MIQTKKIVTLVLWLLAALLVGLIVWHFIGPAPPPAAVRSAGTTVTAVRAVPVVRGNIENHLVIHGDVILRNQVSVYPAAAGRISSLRKQPGDRVSPGETLALVDPSRPGAVYILSPVMAPVGGIVLTRPLNVGETVSTGTVLYTLGDPSSLEVETHVPERYAALILRGTAAQVNLEALPGETFAALTEELAPVLDPASRTRQIRLRFENRDPRILPGMFATIALSTGSRIAVPIIPRQALINTYGTWIVFALGPDDRAERREITLGLEDEDFVEVLEGLSLGEQVVIAGQNFLSPGDQVNVVPTSP
jgi:multidrug efflux pump subunit AcrA (membrane-fusion protein)